MFRFKMLSRLLTVSTRVAVTEGNGVFSRNLYSPAALGIEGFLSARDRTKMQINNIDLFKAKMEEFVKDENCKNLVFTEDLKNMLHISDKSDVDLLSKMIEKFCTQSQETRFGSYVFGPPIMRLLYHLNDTETALKLFNNTNCNGFFDQLISYQIILDLLFNNKMYQEVIDTYDVTRARQVQGGRFPKNAVNLVYAACYKLNTPASLEYATKLWKESNESGHVPLRRAAAFFCTLALNQGKPQIALEILSSIHRQNYVTIKIIKALANANLKRYDDVIMVLKSLLETDNPMANKQTIPKSVVELLKNEFEGNTNKDLQADFDRVVGFLTKHGHLSEQHLDDILCAEIQEFVPSDRNRQDYNNFDGRRNEDDRYRRQDYNRGQGNNQRRGNFSNSGGNRMERPGLHELN